MCLSNSFAKVAFGQVKRMQDCLLATPEILNRFTVILEDS